MVMVGPVDPVEQIPSESDRVAHVLPPEGCKPWVFIANTPREGTEEQLRCVRDTSVEAVIAGLEEII